MNILHINMNYNYSRIHHNIVSEMNFKCGVDGRIFYPVAKRNTEKFDVDFLDVIKCLHSYERFFFNTRNCHLINVAEKTYNIKEFDTILAHSLFSNGFLAMNLSKKHGIPYSVIVTNTDMNVYFSKMLHLRKKGLNILLNANKIVFSSIAYRDELIKKYIPNDFKEVIIKKSASIPFGIDNFWIKNRQDRKEKVLGNNIKLLYVGKVNHNKNLSLTLNACKQLINNGINTQYTVVGDVSDPSGDVVLKKMLSHKFVKYIPSVSFKDLIKLYRDNDIFVMPSITESFGLVYAEALTQGMPIVYTKGQGFDKQFEDNTVGVSVRSNSEDDVVNAVKYIMQNYKMLSNNAYEKSINFSWSEITNRFLTEIGDIRGVVPKE